MTFLQKLNKCVSPFGKSRSLVLFFLASELSIVFFPRAFRANQFNLLAAASLQRSYLLCDVFETERRKFLSTQSNRYGLHDITEYCSYEDREDAAEVVKMWCLVCGVGAIAIGGNNSTYGHVQTLHA